MNAHMLILLSLAMQLPTVTWCTRRLHKKFGSSYLVWSYWRKCHFVLATMLCTMSSAQFSPTLHCIVLVLTVYETILVESCKITLCLIEFIVVVQCLNCSGHMERPWLLHLLILDSHYALSDTTGFIWISVSMMRYQWTTM